MTSSFSVQATLEIQQREGPYIIIQPTKVKYLTSRFSQAALIEVTGISESPLEDVREVSLGLSSGETDPDSDAEVDSPPLVPNATATLFINGILVGSGELQEISVGEEGLVTLTASDAIRNLLQSTFTHSFSEGVVVSTAVRTVIEDAGIIPAGGSEIGDGETAASQPGEIAGESRYDVQVSEAIAEFLNETNAQYGMAPFVTDREFTQVSSLEALSTLLQDVNWYFYCDETNTLNIRPELNPTEWELDYITKTSAGLQSPPYQRVIVTGGNRTPPDSGGSVPNRYMTKQTVAASAGEGRPVYRHTDKSITTEMNAQRVADGILEEFQRQQASGEITIIGNPEIRPLDVVVMPEDMGGESYLVSSITHSITSSDGFLSTLGVGGVVDTGVDQ